MEGLQIPAKNNLIKLQLWWTGQHTASSVKLPTYRFVIYCINTCFIFMNIKPKGIAFWLLQKLCLTKETDLIPYFSHRVFWISMVLFCLVIFFFLSIFFPSKIIWFGILGVVPRNTCVCEVEGKATPKVQFWVKLKVVLVIQVPWIYVSFHKTKWCTIGNCQASTCYGSILKKINQSAKPLAILWNIKHQSDTELHTFSLQFRKHFLHVN